MRWYSLSVFLLLCSLERGPFVSYCVLSLIVRMLLLSSTVSRSLLLLLCSCCASCFIGVSLARAAEVLDTDYDGISDAWETQVFHTDPTLIDTDHDGYNDREEISTGHNPLGSGLLIDPDTDHDGLVDRL